MWRTTISRVSVAVLTLAAICVLVGCGGGSSTPTTTVTIASNPGIVAGGGTFLFSATATNLTSSADGVSLVLALNVASNGNTTTPCTASCGVLSDTSTTVASTSVVDGTTYYNVTTTALYTAPAEPPSPNSLILTATAPTSATTDSTVTFTIGAPAIIAKITNKITNIQPGGAPVTLHATVDFDPKKKGVTWKIEANGSGCSPVCGKLSNAMATSVVYTPPASAPAGANDSPTITATSISDTTKSDFDTFTIGGSSAQPISVTITNPFTTIQAGTGGVTIHASVANDTRGQGVTWTISPAAGAGTLSAATATSVLYTPPNQAPQPPNNTPTITATSVANPGKSASFQFTIEPAAGSAVACALDGQWVFELRGGPGVTTGTSGAGIDAGEGAGEKVSSTEKPVVIIGSLVIDGGKAMIRSVDVNDGSNVQLNHGAVIGASCRTEKVGVSGSAAPAGIASSERSADVLLSKTMAVLQAEQGQVAGLAMDSALVIELGATPTVGALVVEGTSVSDVKLSGFAMRQDLTAFAGFGGDLNISLSNLSGDAIATGNVSVEFSGGVGRVVRGSFTEKTASGETVLTEGALSGVASAPDANGRGTLRLDLAGGGVGGGTSRNFVYYVASGTRTLLVEMDKGSKGVGQVMEVGEAGPAKGESGGDAR